MLTLTPARPTSPVRAESPMETPLPSSFSLSDVSPYTGAPYVESQCWQLPPHVVAILGVNANTWDGLVRTRSVASVFDVTAVYDLSALLHEVASRTGAEPARDLPVCPECWGTLIGHDSDGSVTGVVDAAFVCTCWRLDRFGAAA